MSDTPRTDAATIQVPVAVGPDGQDITHPMVPRNVARELERENVDLRDTLDAVIAADERAVDLWRAAHPGNELVVPDRARLVGWLLEQNAALRKELDWKTERIKLLSDCLHNIDGLLKQAATSVFVDALDAARKEAQP